jgi:hypothetical protein
VIASVKARAAVVVILIEEGSDQAGTGHQRMLAENLRIRTIVFPVVDGSDRPESLRTESKIKKPGVLGAVIDLGNCLNLTEVEALELVKGAHLAYKQLCVASGVAMPQNRGPELRAGRSTRERASP